MMIKITIWDVIAFCGYEALLYAGGPLVLGAVVLLAAPALRRRAGLRRLAYGLLAVTAGFLICATPILAEFWKEHAQKAALEAATHQATHHLTTPQRWAGTTFPAGSTVHLSEDGQVEFGSVPTPTVIAGAPLIGAFRLQFQSDGPPGVAEGTLAAPMDIHGIPCGPGPLISRSETTRCALGRDYLFSGHLLAKDQMLEIYRSPLDEPPMLKFGTLARAERLFDVLWPSGTVMGGINTPPEPIAHGLGPDGQLVEFCVPAGLTATIGDAALHGPMSYSVQVGRRLVSGSCHDLVEEPASVDGYAQVGAVRYTEGERPTADTAWRWSDPVQPANH